LSIPLTGRLSYIRIPVPENAESFRTGPKDSTVSPSDEEIFERLRAGDSDSPVHLFNGYYRLVCTIGMRLLRDRSEAEDLAEHEFLYIFQKRRVFDASKGHGRNCLDRVTYQPDPSSDRSAQRLAGTNPL
jgi:hypothetical protein